MPQALKNLRHERFCQAYVHGPRAGNLAAAYAAAGYTPDRGNASRLGAAPHIKKRIADLIAREHARELRARAVARTRRTAQLRRELADTATIALANPFDLLAIAEDGSITVDEAAVARNKAAIEDFSFGVVPTDNQWRTSIRIRMKDKFAALDKLLALHDRPGRSGRDLTMTAARPAKPITTTASGTKS